MLSYLQFILLLSYFCYIQAFLNGKNQNEPVKFYSPPSRQHYPSHPVIKPDGAAQLSWKAVKNDGSFDLKTSDLFSLDSIRSTLVRQGRRLLFHCLS